MRYFRRFHYAPSEDGTAWRISAWTEDPKRPECTRAWMPACGFCVRGAACSPPPPPPPVAVDYEPDEDDVADEEATIEEEEGIGSHRDHAEEIRELQEVRQARHRA